jgi:hypothetical protein
MNIKKETKEYLDYVRTHPCVVCSANPVDADHLQHRGMGGMGSKGKTHTGTIVDFACVPLCREHHSIRHSMTLRDFESKFRVNLWKEAFMLIRSWYVE